jgi:hypothetical protein
VGIAKNTTTTIDTRIANLIKITMIWFSGTIFLAADSSRLNLPQSADPRFYLLSSMCQHKSSLFELLKKIPSFPSKLSGSFLFVGSELDDLQDNSSKIGNSLIGSQMIHVVQYS